MLKLVETVQTKCTTPELIKGFCEGWYNIYGVLPKKEQIACIYAQNALETGGTTYMWCWNLGNIKAVDSPNETVQYCMLKNVWEIEKGVRVTYQPPHPATWFRAFDTLADGVTFYFNFLRNKRYKNSWTAVEQGDPAKFSHLLKVAGYYTAPEDKYTEGMRYHFNIMMKGPSFDKAMIDFQKELKSIDFPSDFKEIG